jgi:Ca2+-binding RTX toxin-like protein
MATITFNPLVPIDFTTLVTARSTLDIANGTSYDFDSSDLNDIDIEGTGFTYDGSSNLTSGALTRIDIDVGGDQGALNGGDINISGLNITASADLQAIDNGAFSLFGIALQGNDTFLLSGFAEDADTPTATNRLFGDDLNNVILFIIGGTNNNVGGADVFSGGDNRFEISMDVCSLNTVNGFASSTYTGGDDTFLGVTTEEFHRIAGDAWIMDRASSAQMTLNGGDDDIDLGGNSSGSSWVAGDVGDMNNGLLNGGNDVIVSDDSTTPEVAGDVRTYDGGTVNAGDDVISLANSGRAGGDVMFLNAPSPDGVFTLTGGADQIDGGSGDDLIGGDVYDRNSTVDNLIVGGDDVINGGAGHDDLFGEVLFGDAVVGVSGGNDVISGGAGNDELRGQTGDDRLDGGSGNDTIDGGVGDDTITYASAGAGVSVNLLVVGAQNTIGAGVDSLLGGENLEGSRFDDTLRGNNVSNQIAGGRGNDSLFSGAGEDELLGGAGEDVLNAVGQTGDLLAGGTGDDLLQSDSGGNVLVGGSGSDTVSFATAVANSTINLASGQASRSDIPSVDVLFSIENAVGGGGSDTLTGDELANALTGLAGADTLTGGLGDDSLDGGVGADTLTGGDGLDVLFGGDDGDRLNGGAGDDSAAGGLGNDRIFGEAGADNLNGEAGADTLQGGTGNDLVVGGDGADNLRGDQGRDSLLGGAERDRLDGGADQDILSGGEGVDTHIGGAGADTLIFAPTAGSTQDIVIGFEDTGAISDDLIDVSAYGFASVASITASAAGNDVILDFGDGDTVRLVDYLLTHTLNDIDAGDFIL